MQASRAGDRDRGDQAIELLDSSKTSNAEHQRTFRVESELMSQRVLIRRRTEEVGFNSGGNHAHLVVGLWRPRADLLRRKFAHRDDPSAQRKDASLDRRHVAPEYTAHGRARLDPLRIQLGVKQENQRRARHYSRPSQR